MTPADKSFFAATAIIALYLSIGILYAAYHYQRFECARPPDFLSMCEADRSMAAVPNIAVWPIYLWWDAAIAITKPGDQP